MSKIKRISFSLGILAITATGLVFVLTKAPSALADDCSAEISIDTPTQITKTDQVEITACWRNGFTADGTITIKLSATKNGVETVDPHGLWYANAGDGTERHYVGWDTGSSDPGTYIITLEATSETGAKLASTQTTVSVATVTTGGTGGTGTGGGGVSGGTETGTGGTIDLTPGKITDFQTLFNDIIIILQLAATIAALIGVIYGGINILQSGGDSPKVANGKKILLYSLVGLVLAMFTKLVIFTAIDYLKNLKG